MGGTESQEMYLKSIYTIEQRKGVVRKIDIAEELGLSKPSVKGAVDRLIAAGEAETDERNNVFLTESGRKHAERIVKRYDAFLEMLTNMDIPREKAKDAACKLEHAIDDDIFDYIEDWLKKNRRAE
ncbi:MAG: metal-dependent transcriptional regulator [Clostridia bacterium]|nr:metal-dependent transcriptional regulator [Clostridia bacterium]